ncbi:MAG: hypothetical protein IPI79_07520 [Moraxellaceae bacterium]|nr:hypothetical protein [Moraxellaceae bacterium]
MAGLIKAERSRPVLPQVAVAEGAIKAMQTIRHLTPVNAPISSMVLAGCVGAVTGGIIGSKLGEFVDENILDNYQCLRCGYTFSKPRE